MEYQQLQQHLMQNQDRDYELAQNREMPKAELEKVQNLLNELLAQD